MSALQAGICGIDLHTGTIIVRGDGPALTVEVPSDSMRPAESGRFLGRSISMAPEQMMGDPDADAKTDIFALGVVLYRMLAGRTPWQADDLPRLFTLVTTAPPDLSEIGVSATLKAIVQKCLEKNPADRYAEAEAIAKDLRETPEYTGD